MKPRLRNPELTILKRSETNYPTDPGKAKLEAFRNAYPDRDYWVRFDCPEFTALCPITNQPDFGRITIEYIPGRWCIESKALKLYLYAFRNHNTFHEEAVNRILDDVVRAIKPRRIRVVGEFNPRGGIAIRVEASRGMQKVQSAKS